jgi:hypothetical protein
VRDSEHGSRAQIPNTEYNDGGRAARRSLRLRAPASPSRRPAGGGGYDQWTVTDDWPDEVPITEAEIDVFEAWFGDLFDELFSTRH